MRFLCEYGRFSVQNIKIIRKIAEFFVSLQAKMRKRTIRIGKDLLELDEPVVMGIVNMTPDSFAVSCKDMTDEEVLTTATKAVEEGALILDVGGYSTRPGAPEVSMEEEWRRVSQALRAIRSRYPDVALSVDTFRSEVARRSVLEYGVAIINDISGGELDEKMYDVVKEIGRAHV